MPSSIRRTRILVAIFAVAMAWVEAAVVYDLRVLVDRLQPYQANPLPMAGALGNIELVREVATLVMLAAVGWLAGGTLRARLAYSAIAFGVWDVFYYVSLRVMHAGRRRPTGTCSSCRPPWWTGDRAVSIAVPMIMGTLATASPDSQQSSSEPDSARRGPCAAPRRLRSWSTRRAAERPQAKVPPETFNWPMPLGAAPMVAPVAAMVLRDIAPARLVDSACQVAEAPCVAGRTPLEQLAVTSPSTSCHAVVEAERFGLAVAGVIPEQLVARVEQITETGGASGAAPAKRRTIRQPHPPVPAALVEGDVGLPVAVEVPGPDPTACVQKIAKAGHTAAARQLNTLPPESPVHQLPSPR